MSQKSKFEKLIGKHERNLHGIRSRYFPLITDGTITGYNLYPNLFDYSYGSLFLNYLHSDLKPKDRHSKELFRILRTKGFLEEKIMIHDELIDREETMEREAEYRTRPDWEDPINMRYFDFNGEELSLEKAKSLKRSVIGESLQYDLLLKIKNEPELRNAVDLFKRYASKNLLDKYGKEIIKGGYPIENKDAIFNSWEIPLLICTSRSNKKPRNLCDFLAIYQFNIQEQLGDSSIILSTLVKAKWKEFKRFLEEEKNKFQVDKKYALRVFVEDYIDI